MRAPSIALRLAGLLCGALAWHAGPGLAQPVTQAAAKAAGKPAAKSAPRPDRPATRQGAATASAPASAPAEPLSPGQLDVVDRVLTGVADCEFRQQISVLPLPGRHGHFEIRFQKARYVMTPRETATGAVRLEDPQTGMLWIQIPAKSMLMDSRRGQRVVDHCMHSEQRAAMAAVKEAAVSLGIAPAAAATGAPAASVAPAAASAASAAPGAVAASAAPAGVPAAAAPASATTTAPASRQP